MRYAGVLLQNEVTLTIPISDNFNDLNVNLRDAIVKCRAMKNGIFYFRFIQIFHNFDKTQGYDWTSFVVDLNRQELNYFCPNKTSTYVIWVFLNYLLTDEAIFQEMENDAEAKTFLHLGLESEFELPVYGESEDFRNDTDFYLFFMHGR
jgi:hypothetical protein